MKKIAMLKKVLFCLSFMFILNNCSTEQDQNAIEDTQIEQTDRAPETTQRVLIEWGEGTTQSSKEAYRHYYIEKGVLVSVDPCEDNKYEAWTVNVVGNSEKEDPVDPKEPGGLCCMKSATPKLDCADVD